MKAFISGCNGLQFSPEERAFFQRENPWGLILFARNCETPEQISALTAEFRALVGRDDAPVLIDQEGGRVQRLKPPHWPKYPAGAAYGALYHTDREKGTRAAWLGARLMADDLFTLGITVDCLPVLDVPVAGAHDVIGDRAYASEPEEIIPLAKAAIDGLQAGGVLPVMKHIPGHGRAHVDSHVSLPVVKTARNELEDKDFRPFKALIDTPLAMTAHVTYTALDPDRCATLSPTIIGEVIRGHIGFRNILMSDDVSMGALGGTMDARCRAIVEAGCDLVLHCNGVFEEMITVAENTPEVDAVLGARLAAALDWAPRPGAFDRPAAEAEFAAICCASAV